VLFPAKVAQLLLIKTYGLSLKGSFSIQSPGDKMRNLKSSKLQILIIETNDCKFFVAKQVLQSQFKIELSFNSAKTPLQLAEISSELSPDIIFCCPEGGVVELLKELKSRNTNKRNSNITLLLAEELAEHFIVETPLSELTQILKETSLQASTSLESKIERKAERNSNNKKGANTQAPSKIFAQVA
jgi:response regulator RpfG family c-di-GMP phosphodiesterase